MDIKQFSYFTTIVECGYNLSAAAKKIHITQSALSKTISTFEQEEGIRLFSRVNGRLNSLTPAGELFYEACLDITQKYNTMMEQARLVSRQEKGTVKVGIPPLVLSVLFPEIISTFSRNYPQIKLALIEDGAEELCIQFTKRQVDFAVVLSPSYISPSICCEHLICLDELTAFMSLTHPLARQKSLKWRDLESHPIALFNESFSINRYVLEKFKEEKIKPTIAFQSSSWDFLFESVISSNLITLLPSPIKSLVRTSQYVEIPFEDPIPWRVVLAEYTKEPLTPPQQLFKTFTLNYVKEQQQAE